MEKKWDGKTKGSPLGYRFFIFCVRVLGIRIAYFFCLGVSGYFIAFATKPRNALIRFYQTGLGLSKAKARSYAAANFYRFGQILIDRIAFKTHRKKQYTFRFNNEEALIAMHAAGKGGFLFSGHLGNWENAGSLLGERITYDINVLMLDAEVQKIKELMERTLEKASFNLIPIKDDLSHLITIHQKLKNNEMIALHADRVQPGQKSFRLPFLNGVAEFPAGPFIMAYKFKVPLTFVFAVKAGRTHYELSATDPITSFDSPEQIAATYVNYLEKRVKETPKQWFNFYDYFVEKHVDQ
jgi:predicted LPLAT superfamily acyltransferase